mgnify:FL=1
MLSINDTALWIISRPAEYVWAKLLKLIHIAILTEINSDGDIITVSLALRTGE